jgi:hypothetical protein
MGIKSLKIFERTPHSKSQIGNDISAYLLTPILNNTAFRALLCGIKESFKMEFNAWLIKQKHN